MKYVVILFLLASTNVFGSPEVFYSGYSQDRYHFALHLHGAEFLGKKGDFLIIRPAVRITRNNREIKTVDHCSFIYNPDNREQDRIECAKASNSRLSGVVYVRNSKIYNKSHGEIDEMVCAKRCNPKAPKFLRLISDEDNA